jgi:hypothetical protein
LGLTVPKKLPFLPDEHHYAIAHVATRAAQLDHQIEFCVNAQMGSHREAAKYLIKSLDTPRLIELLRVLLQDNFPTRISEIEALIQEIKAARAERNEVLHWVWGKDADPAIAKLASLRLYREEQIKTKTAEELYALADRLLAAVSALTRFDPWVLKTFGEADSKEPAQAPSKPPTA